MADLPANWARCDVRVFALDTINGNDACLGWADSSGQTQSAIAAATVAAAAVAKKTIAGLLAVFPTEGAGRIAHIVCAGAAAGDLTLRTNGYQFLFVRATGTNANANAVAFSGSSADLAYLGGSTATGFNAPGYASLVAGTNPYFTCEKFGGGTPGFGTYFAGLAAFAYRVRFDAATTTAALQGKCYSIQWSDSGNRLFLSEAITIAAGDKFYIEMAAGFTCDSVTIAGNSIVAIAGLNASLLSILDSDVRVAFCKFNSIAAGRPVLAFKRALPEVFLTYPQVGPTRAVSAEITEGSFFADAGSYGSSGTLLATRCLSVIDRGSNEYGSTVHLIGGVPPLLAGGDFNFGGPQGDNFKMTLLGANLLLDGVKQSFGRLYFTQSIPVNDSIEVVGSCELSFQGQVSGVNALRSGLSLARSFNSRIAYRSVDTDANEAMHASGAGGDIYGGTNFTINAAPIYASYTGLARTGRVLISGVADITLLQSSAQPQVARDIGISLAVPGYNHSGVDIPVTASGKGALVRFGVVGDAYDIAIAKADLGANCHGMIGQAVSACKNGDATWVIIVGVVDLTWSDGGPVEAGGQPAYISDITAGTVRRTPPVIPSVVRQIGYAIGEAGLALHPTNRLTPQIVPNGTVVVGLGAFGPTGVCATPVRWVRMDAGDGTFFTVASYT